MNPARWAGLGKLLGLWPGDGDGFLYNDEGSAWEHTASEAPPRKAGGACKAHRSQAEPGNKVLLAFARVMIKATISESAIANVTEL